MWKYKCCQHSTIVWSKPQESREFLYYTCAVTSLSEYSRFSLIDRAKLRYLPETWLESDEIRRMRGSLHLLRLESTPPLRTPPSLTAGIPAAIGQYAVIAARLISID